MNPYQAPEPCTDEESQRGGIMDLLLFGLMVITFGPPAIAWLLSRFRETTPHTTFTEDVVGYMLIASWQASIGCVTAVVWIPFLLRLTCIS